MKQNTVETLLKEVILVRLTPTLNEYIHCMQQQEGFSTYIETFKFLLRYALLEEQQMENVIDKEKVPTCKTAVRVARKMSFSVTLIKQVDAFCKKHSLKSRNDGFNYLINRGFQLMQDIKLRSASKMKVGD